jgi:hypothetical protein
MMAEKNIWKNFVDRLTQEELTYELECRGIPTGTVADMRKGIRQVFKLDQNKSLSEIHYAVDFKTDQTAVVRYLDELDGLLQSFDGDTRTSSFTRVSALVRHLERRLERVVATKEDEKVELNRLKVRASQIKSDFEDSTKVYRRKSVAACSTPVRSDFVSSEYSDEEVELEVETPTNSDNRSVLVAKWNVTFDGHGTASLNAFLERVGELRVARGVSTSQLFRSAIDLFSGDALTWFRSIRNDVRDWNDLVSRLKFAFLPPDYDERLNQEIEHRLQGELERPTLYVAAMRNLFGRLTVIPTEAEQLKRVVRNLQPRYAHHLIFRLPQTFDELAKNLSCLEESVVRDRRFDLRSLKEPPLEPDLAVRTPRRQERVHEFRAASTSRPPLTCWNCSKTGHLFRDCSEPHRRRCFKCHHPNVTVRNCPNCTDCIQVIPSVVPGEPSCSKNVVQRD